jgi:hypothetical protein
MEDRYYDNMSKGDKFPKTLEIRNTSGGLIWQVYHVNNLNEANLLSRGASNNAFQSRILVDYYDEEETFPDWRNECTAEIKAVLEH